MSDHLDERPLPSTTGPGDLLKRYWYLALGLVIALGAFTHWWRTDAFNDIGYAPLQPIPYSHKLHAGELGIDCRYCHYNAERGKHAGVPPISVCMGCHSPDMGGAGAESEKVQKLLALVAESDELPGYLDTDDLDHQGQGHVMVGNVIHWNRVHDLPDHAYFSHEWHVAAGVACQTCHGPIEEMEVVEQFAPLEMGWCIECHRDDNYVGGRQYDGSPESFTVGTADYSVFRQRIRPDQVVSLVHPVTRGGPHAHGHGHDHGHDEHGDDEHGHADAHHHPEDAGHHDEEAHMPVVENAASPGQDLRGLFPEVGDDQVHNDLYVSAAQIRILNAAFQGQDLDEAAASHAGLDELPRWRIPDLPQIHVQFYQHQGLWDEDGDGKIDPDYLADIDNVPTLQNAPTQCNTCHQ